MEKYTTEKAYPEFKNFTILVHHFTQKQSVSLIQLLSHHYKCTPYFNSVVMSQFYDYIFSIS
jgi:hypothetical protein